MIGLPENWQHWVNTANTCKHQPTLINIDRTSAESIWLMLTGPNLGRRSSGDWQHWVNIANNYPILAGNIDRTCAESVSLMLTGPNIGRKYSANAAWGLPILGKYFIITNIDLILAINIYRTLAENTQSMLTGYWQYWLNITNT